MLIWILEGMSSAEVDVQSNPGPLQQSSWMSALLHVTAWIEI